MAIPRAPKAVLRWVRMRCGQCRLHKVQLYGGYGHRKVHKVQCYGGRGVGVHVGLGALYKNGSAVQECFKGLKLERPGADGLRCTGMTEWSAAMMYWDEWSRDALG